MTSVTTSNNHSNGDLQVPDHDSVKRGGSGSSASSGHSVKAPSVRDVLAEKAIDAKTLGWMANAMGELHQATEQIDVEDVGDLIVTLSPPLAQ
ncbi:hypothetical protein BG000_003067 [Podila horticola]|nr:hypothetical protein BG003_004692 [Podila horticola]KAG0321924.1 hypothetical protein BG000_003067 [Podila horticola]